MPITLEGLAKDSVIKLVGENFKHQSRLFELVDSSILYLSGEAVPAVLPKVFIAVTPPGVSLLTNYRRQSGRLKVREMATTSKAMMKLLDHVGFFRRYYDLHEDRFVELCAERGAVPMRCAPYMPYAGLSELEESVKISCGVKRYQTSETSPWYAEVRTTKPFEDLWQSEGHCLLIGNDCNASGASECYLIEYIFNQERQLKRFGGFLKKVLILEACASSQGIKRCHALCLKLGLEVIFVLNSAVIDLVVGKGYSGKTETDLPLLNTYTILPANMQSMAERLYFGKQKFCSIGDATRGSYYPREYTMETMVDMRRAEWPIAEERANGFPWIPDPWTSKYFHKWLRSRALSEEEGQTLDYFGVKY